MRIPQLSIGIILFLLSILIFNIELGLLRHSNDVQFQKLTSTEVKLIYWLTDYVDRFKTAHSRLPTTEEIDMWIARQAKGNTYELFSYQYLTDHYPKELNYVYGQAPKDNFVIRFKAPYKYVYFPSWSRSKEKAYILSSDYFLLGSKLGSLIFYSSLLVLGLSLSIFLIYKSFNNSILKASSLM